MKHAYPLVFDALEDRKLLTKAHAAVAHPATPLAIVGTLTVDNAASTESMGAYGTWITSVPVAGQLGALGQVHGVWNETVDAYGDYDGPDVLRLNNAKGTLYITFDDQSSTTAHKDGPGTIYVSHTQHLDAGTGAYAKSSEVGTIEIVSNTAKTVVKSLVLNSTTS